jgi:hypothetical protein
MANARPGYKRIMGEIPEEIHEKITLYNKTSDRPLNISKTIERCIQQAVKIIETELVEQASIDEKECNFIIIHSDKIYKAIKTDLEENELSDIGIYKHYLEMVKQETTPDDKTIKTMLYPINWVTWNDLEIPIDFYAEDILCFSLAPNCPACEWTKRGWDRTPKNEGN